MAVIVIMIMQSVTMSAVHAQSAGAYIHAPYKEGRSAEKRRLGIADQYMSHERRADFNKERLKKELMALPPAARAKRIEENKKNIARA